MLNDAFEKRNPLVTEDNKHEDFGLLTIFDNDINETVLWHERQQFSNRIERYGFISFLVFILICV